MSTNTKVNDVSTFAPFLPTSQPHSQCGSGRLEDVKILVSHYAQPPEETDANGRTLLHHAVWFNHPAVLQVLLERSSAFVVNMQDNFGNTALFYAVNKDDESFVKIISLLMRSGANADVPNKQHRTARLALYSGQRLQHNADVSRMISPDTALAATGTRQTISLTSTAVLSAARTANTRTVSGGFLSKARIAHSLRIDELNRDSAAVFTSLHTYGPNIELVLSSSDSESGNEFKSATTIMKPQKPARNLRFASNSLLHSENTPSPVYTNREHPYTHPYQSSSGFQPFNFQFLPEPIPSLPSDKIEDIVVRVSRNPHSSGTHSTHRRNAVTERNLHELKGFTRAKLNNTKSLLGVLPNSIHALTEESLTVLSPSTATRRDFWNPKSQQVDKAVIQTLHQSLRVQSPRDQLSSPRRAKPALSLSGLVSPRKKMLKPSASAGECCMTLTDSLVPAAKPASRPATSKTPDMLSPHRSGGPDSLRGGASNGIAGETASGGSTVETHISQISLQNQHLRGLVSLLENTKLSNDDQDALLHHLDVTRDGKVDIEDYWSALIPRIGCLNALPAHTLSESIDKVFLFIDSNKNGLIDVEDLLVLKDKLSGLLHIDNEREAVKFIELAKKMYVLGKEQLFAGLRSYDGGAAYIQWKSHPMYPPENTLYTANQEEPIEQAPGLNREVFFGLAGGVHENFVNHLNKLKKELKEKGNEASRPQSSLPPKASLSKMASVVSTDAASTSCDEIISIPVSSNTSIQDLTEFGSSRTIAKSHVERTYKLQPIGPRASEIPINKP